MLQPVRDGDPAARARRLVTSARPLCAARVGTAEPRARERDPHLAMARLAQRGHGRRSSAR